MDNDWQQEVAGNKRVDGRMMACDEESGRRTTMKQPTNDEIGGGPVQDLSNFQMAPIPFLGDLTCSTHSPHDILKVKKKIDNNLPVGHVKRDIRVLDGCSLGFLSVFD